MSLEEAIKENTAAVRELISALKTSAPAASAATTASEAPKSSPKSTKASGAKGASEPQQAAASTPATTATPSSPSTQASAAAPATDATAGAEKPLDYNTVREAVLAYMSKNGRDALFNNVFNKWGVQNAQQLKPEQYAAFMKTLNGEATDGVA